MRNNPVQLTWILAILLVMASRGPVIAETQEPQSTSATPDEVARWVRDLDSDRYIERRQATERLIQSGTASISPIVKAVQEGSLETVARGLHVLAELASSTDFATECAACEALQLLVAKQGTVIARRASSMLADLGPIRYERAKAFLTGKGAVVSAVNVQTSNRTRQPFPSVTFGEAWSGSLDDLHRLRWLLESASDDAFEGSNWLLSFEGAKITDEYLERISTLNNVVAIKIRKTSVTEIGISHLKGLKRLRFLDILYNPLPKSAIPHLCQLPSPMRMRLYGTKLEKDDLDELRANLRGTEIDVRLGGFLGVGCDLEPCRITLVGRGTAAERAGLQQEDLIMSYNGQPVNSFDSLTLLIGKNQPGDEVSVEVNRLGETVIVKVTLGECWE